MHRKWSLSALLFLCGSVGCGQTPKFDAARAFEHLKNQVALGPRIPGSEAHRKAKAYIMKELQAIGGISVEEDPFVAATPKGEFAMANVLAALPGKSKESILLASHYDTKDIGTPPCPGANDGASTTGLLIELARSLAANGPHPFTFRFAFFDGEEAFVEWSETDSLYGSRHLVERWSKDGSIKGLRAMILFDLVGDADLGVIRESLSSGWLVEAFGQAAKELGYSQYFFRTTESIEDDHRPFLAAGIPAINIFDSSYGPRRSLGLGEYWHSAKDTVEHCSMESLRIVGEVGLRAIEKIQSRLKK